jgi:hypothetical protein
VAGEAPPDADDLYALDPTEFTAARNALAKELKAAGRKDEAAVVAALRRPPATAWALNQVARHDPDLVTTALEAGSRLRAATDAAMGGDASGLRDASAEERAASGALVAAAAGHLGASAAQAEGRLAATVHAAVLDEEVADQLRRGVLAADHDRSGLGLGTDLGMALGAAPQPAAGRARHLRAVPDRPSTPRAPATGSKRPDAAERRRAAEEARREEAEARRQAEEQARQEAEAREREEEARRRHRRELRELEAIADRAAGRAARLDRAARDAEQAAAEARAAADVATGEAEAAAQALAEAEARAPVVE